jgi:tRNA wybutosine-synthesizing protein 4
MCNNLRDRSSPLLGISHFPHLESQKERYLNSGFHVCPIMSLNDFWMNFLSKEEINRIESLELFDEEEDWKVKCSHYFVSSLKHRKMN